MNSTLAHKVNPGTVTGGDHATVSGGVGATVSGGDHATVSGGDGATVSGGDHATVSGGDRARVSGGDVAEILIRWYDSKAERYRTKVGYVGEKGIEPNVAYRLNDKCRFVRAA